MLQLIELRQKLKELHSAASVDHLAKVDLESQQYRLQDDTSRLEKRLAAAEADRESLGHQLKVGCLSTDSRHRPPAFCISLEQKRMQS